MSFTCGCSPCWKHKILLLVFLQAVWGCGHMRLTNEGLITVTTRSEIRRGPVMDQSAISGLSVLLHWAVLTAADSQCWKVKSLQK